MTTRIATPITLLDLAAEREELGPALEEAVVRCLRSGQYILGPEVEKLERSFAEMCGVPHAVAVSTGTEALVLGLRALGVEAGDHVVTSPFTFFASAGAIAWIGAIPRFADIDPDSALLTPASAATAIDSKTTALLPIHLYGQLVDMAGFRSLADERAVALLEDGAQAHGARRAGTRVGELGSAATFSFYPTKNLGAIGEGGLLVTRLEAVANELRLLRDQGSSVKYEHSRIGTNARMHAIQAAALNVKLPHLARWNERRRAIAARYGKAFASSTTVRPLVTETGSEPVYHQYAVRICGAVARDEVLQRLKERGVHAAVHYPGPVHMQPAAKAWGYGPGDFPHAEALAAQVLCLPVHPFLADADVDRVADAVSEIAQA